MSENDPKVNLKEFTPPNLTKRSGLPPDDAVCNVRKYNISLNAWRKFDSLSDAIKSRQHGECVIWDDK